MKAGFEYSTPCETFAEGEVEDYTVNIVTANNLSAIQMKNTFNGANIRLAVSPNPANDIIPAASGVIRGYRYLTAPAELP